MSVCCLVPLLLLALQRQCAACVQCVLRVLLLRRLEIEHFAAAQRRQNIVAIEVNAFLM